MWGKLQIYCPAPYLPSFSSRQPSQISNPRTFSPLIWLVNPTGASIFLLRVYWMREAGESVEKMSSQPHREDLKGRSGGYSESLPEAVLCGPALLAPSSLLCPGHLVSGMTWGIWTGIFWAPRAYDSVVGVLVGGTWGLLRKEGMALHGYQGMLGPTQKVPSCLVPVLQQNFLWIFIPLCLHLPELSQ